MLEVLDPWLYRHPFEGRSARRYARDERPAFGDLDARLCERWASDLGRAKIVLDVGAGPGTFAATVRARWPETTVIAADPSRAFAEMLARDGGAVCARRSGPCSLRACRRTRAREAGWSAVERDDDELQPVYRMRIT